VVRQGRLTQGQNRAIERSWGRFGIEPSSGETLSLPRVFGNPNPVWMEIGFGNGENLLQLALSHPEWNLLGVEVHRPGIGRLLLALETQGVANVGLLQADAMEILRYYLRPASLQGLLVLFPDPWPKQRHHKRRLVQAEFATLAARALETGGLLQMATDWEDYAQQMLQVMDAVPELLNLAGAGQFAPRQPDRPVTRFERRGQGLGHGVWELLYRRR